MKEEKWKKMRTKNRRRRKWRKGKEMERGSKDREERNERRDEGGQKGEPRKGGEKHDGERFVRGIGGRVNGVCANRWERRSGS